MGAGIVFPFCFCSLLSHALCFLLYFLLSAYIMHLHGQIRPVGRNGRPKARCIIYAMQMQEGDRNKKLYTRNENRS